MTQREVFPQAQSLCATVQLRHVQYSHQIHLRWFTSSTKRATIQTMISVRDITSNVSASNGRQQWADRPRSAGRRSYGEIDTEQGAASERRSRPERVRVATSAG